METLGKPTPFGPFLLHARIDSGGMAEVYLATSKQKEELNLQFIAIKKLLPHLNSNRPFVNLLIHEAKVGVLLNHPSIATVFDLGSHKSEFFIAMEYVHGKSLERLLQRLQERNELHQLPIEVSTHVVMELLRALNFAHELKDTKMRDLQIVHRDVTPGNILLSYRGDVKLTDFGIATAEHRLQAGFTQVALGKLNYISPEQALNDTVGRSSDLYSVGVILYLLYTGALPYSADNSQELIRKVIEGRYIPLRERKATVHPELEAIVMKCLHRSPKQRFQSAPELFQALRQFFQSHHNVDFTSRTVRGYYQKRLSDFIKAAFSKEVTEEANVIQQAFGSMEEDNAASFKKTAPQDRKTIQKLRESLQNKSPSLESNYFEDEDHTVFQQDVSEENTRQFRLDAEEREELFKLATQGTTLEVTKTELVSPSAFPKGPFLQPSFPHLTLEQKLKISSLNREEKEQLKDQLPKMEINDIERLDEFEEMSLTSRGIEAPSDSESSRRSDRTEIIQNYKELEKSLRKRSKKFNFRWPKIKLPAIKIPTFTIPKIPWPTLKWTKATKPKSRTKKFKLPRFYLPRITVRSLILPGILIGITALSIAAIRFYPTWWPVVKKMIPKGPLLLTPTQNIELAFIFPTEMKLSRDRAVDSLKAIEPKGNLSQVEALFNSEYRRYTKDSDDALRLFIRSTDDLVFSQAELDALIRSPQVFFETMASKEGELDSPIIYLVLFPSDYAGPSSFKPPQDYFQPRPRARGLVYGAFTQSSRLDLLSSLARQIAHVYGGRDKWQATTNLPKFPEGFSNPEEKPLYPQSKAELMGITIPFKEGQPREINGLYELMIGTQTAKELGWVK